MDNFNLTEITEIAEVNGESSANAYLAAGWKLLQTVQKRDGSDSWIAYAVGWPLALPSKKPNH